MSIRVRGVVLLGCDYQQYGVVDTSVVSPLIAASISVGADPASPSKQFKGLSAIQNEDAVAVVEVGPVVVMAVADAHFGHEASHQLIQAVAHQVKRNVPATLKDVYDILTLIGASIAAETESESTLVVVVLDRERGTGFGVSYGDSTAALVGPEHGFRQLNHHTARYVRTDSFLTPTPGASFEFTAHAGDVLLVYTDGINECHYRNPATSLQPADIEHYVDRFGADPQQLVDRLAHGALVGVQGNPGGQDNVAVAAASTAWSR